MTEAGPLQALAFRCSTVASILVATDAPRWTIVDASDAYCAITHHPRASLIGKGTFDAFPESAETHHDEGTANVRRSFEQAVSSGARVILPVQRYDLERTDQPGQFDEHHWELSSLPLFDVGGACVAVLHEVVNVTARITGASERARMTEEIEQRNRQLEENAVELEAQTEELQATAVQLEERSREAERARTAAEAAKRELQMVFAQSPTAVAVTRGAEHRFVLANPRFELLVGRPVPVGTTFRESLPEIAEQGYEAMLDQVWLTGEPRAEQEAHARVNKGGPELEDGWYNFVYQPLFDEDGEVIGIMQHGMDVTGQVRARVELERLFAESERERAATEVARRDAEEMETQFRALVDTMPTLAWAADKDGSIGWYNARWYEYTGTVAADMEGWGWTTVHHPAVLPDVLDRWHESIASGEPFEMTFPLRGRDGTFRQFLTRVVPARDAEGQVIRWFGTNTDVEHEARLRMAAEEANRAKSEFLAVMSHELRTPLNAIDGYAALIEMEIPGPVSDAQRDFIGKIRKSQRHLLGLIDGVLNYARVEAGATQFASEDVSLDEALSVCQELIAPQAFAKGLTLTYERPEAGLAVRADGEKVKQVVLNLLTNATKFTDRGGQIDLACAVRGDQVAIAVRDTGRGIAPEQVTRVFEPFVQLDANFTRVQDGVGLGLAISRDLARGMGGDIMVRSEVGVGSEFTLVLPRA